jgi:large subunit ribosomal protein L15
MQSHEIRPPKGALHKQRKRVGRGDSAGQGSYSGKGMKGQKARSGNDIRVGFEGGQLPLIRRMSRKRGFTNRFRVEYEIVNLAQLSKLEAGSEVTPESLRAMGVVKKEQLPVKVLGEGDLAGALTVKANRFSASAKAKIEAAGGRWEELGGTAGSDG